MIKNVEKLLEKIYEGIKNHCDVAVIGMSGGADSTLVSILLTQALGKENVYSVHMPYGRDIETFNSRSMQTARKLEINIAYIPIDKPCNNLKLMVNNGIKGSLSKLAKGNIRSRMRMVTLYSVCNYYGEILQKRVRVVGTGNLSEDFIGYDTKFGDAACDFFPIGDLFKSEVYQLLDYFIQQGIISEEDVDRIPSAGLWDGQTDEKELGYSYNQMEPIIQKFLNNNFNGIEIEGSIEKFIYDRYVNNKHKHEAPKVFQLRNLIEE